MFFVVSKALWLLLDPVMLLLECALIGTLISRRRPRLGRALALIGVGALLFIAFTPTGVLLLRPLEQRFPPPPSDAPAPHGIVVLGGAIEDELSAAHRQVELGEGGSRLTEAVILARRFPEARLVYTGGNGWPAADEKANDATEARDLFIELGIDPARIAIETRSRNTDENARFTAALVKPKPDEIWWLVTSAYHMPRAMGLFEKAGFALRAYPVDYRGFGDARDFWPGHDPLREIRQFEIAVHEWIGLAGYHLTGKIDAWFPGPHSELGAPNR
jgi:uncharacterized SAM-binding protein YcdF (DUF218 family)